MNWVDDDPCECCGSGEHYLEYCSVFYEKVQANKEREDYLSGLFDYRRADYEDFNGPSSHYPYTRPPLPPEQERECPCCGKVHIHEDCPVFWKDPMFWKEKIKSGYKPPSYKGYYQSNVNNNYEPKWDYDSYELEMPCFPSYQEEYDDYYYEYPQPAYEEPQVSTSSKLDAIMNAIIISNQEIKMELKKELEAKDKANEALAKKVSQLAEELAQLRRDQEVLASGTLVDDDVVEEVTELPEQETECLNRAEDITPQDGSEPKEAHIHIDPFPTLITPTNKVGDEGSGIRIRRVVLQDIGRFGKKRPRSCTVRMPNIIKRVWIRHAKYRAYVGNSVGKCALRPP
ncbi:hypothetical protein HanRHA438_Chr17g0809341 [Helianthus annuus]|nr:hypothetical protein HanHA89_Chr17g0703261 [Helianthus annuus]KAJ0818896.1 hypothetical protein HanLR1_Chr00c0301g0737111 [Helianthus annuus]KAJ0825999.1 hypothetical protein HanRHA438_Chr17g0809341 [Helianthus annuus]